MKAMKLVYVSRVMRRDAVEPIIKVRDLYKIFKIGDNKVYALNGVSFDVYQGEFVAIVGTSGSGKSTCLNMLAGLEAPSRGAIQIAGKRIDKMSEAELVSFRRQNVGFIFQSYNLIGSMNAVENVAMPLMFRGVPYEKRIREAEKYMKLIGIGDQGEHMPNQMSGGQQQRVAIARALAAKPPLILADEPTGNLDSNSGKEVMRIINELWAEGRTIILITHDDSIAETAHRVIRISDGKIVDDYINENVTPESNLK